MVNYPKDRSKRTLGSGGSSSVGAIRYDAENIKDRFFRSCSARRAQRISGDGGYWTGGRCDWGAGHNLDEDIAKLIGSFNKAADMSDAIQSLKDCNSSEEFQYQKTALLEKADQAIRELKLKTIQENVGYRSGLCIIWTDYTADFLTPYLNKFAEDLEKQKLDIDSLSYEEFKQLEKLQLEEQQIKKDIEEAYQKYNETTDPDEQAEILMAIRNLKKQHDEVINKITANSWNRIDQYDYTHGIEQILRILEGKEKPGQTPFGGSRTPNPNNQNQNNNQGGSSGNTNLPPNLPNNPWNPNQPNKDSNQLDQQTLMIIIGAVIVILFIVMNQKDSSSHRKDYEYYDY